MRSGPQKVVPVVLLSLLALTFSDQLALGKKKDRQASAGQMDDQKRALHALSRLTFGPRPGDVERVTALGVDKWIDQQLHPEKIDDSALEMRLSPFRTLRMDTRELVENFPPPQLIKQVEDGKQQMPSDPTKRAVYEDQMDRLQEKQDRKKEAATADSTDTIPGKLTDEERARRRERRLEADRKIDDLLDLPPDQRMKQVLRMSPEERRALSASLKNEQRDAFIVGMNPQQRETLMALSNPQQVVTSELMQGKLLRAIYSDRQLQEVMTDFWFNHFNVFIGKAADRYLIPSYERDVIRPHAMGKFEDLLMATAQSPAMLFYLDNWLSVGPNSDVANGVTKRRKHAPQDAPIKTAKGKRNGLNENYGRELMELHTLGVNGGYTQKDVTEVARVFTGWTLKRPKEGTGFTFEPRMHEPGDKIVLGHRIKSNGEKEGREVLHILARHPSTAKFVCTELAMRFVSDEPPAPLVDRMAHTFLKKDGDIREVLKTMLQSPEFWSADAYRAKVTTPLEFVVSAVRASGAEVSDATPLAHQLDIMGMPLYGMQPPTGYSMKASTWVNSAALLGRMNFALALTAGKLRGIQTTPEAVIGGDSTPNDSTEALAMLEGRMLAGDVSRQTHDTIAAQMNDPKISLRRLDDPRRPPNLAAVAGLILGSPEFQKR